MKEVFPGPFTVTKVTPLTPYGFHVQWALKTAKDSGAYTFEVFRSGSDQGPWESISGPLTNQYAFVDRLPQPEGTVYDQYRRANKLALSRYFVYRVVCTTPTKQILEAFGDTDPKLDYLHAQQWRRAVFDFRLAMRKQGVPIAVLKRRRWGVRCAKCVDMKTREQIRGACAACWGTGIVDGYWDPVLVMGRRAPTQSTTQTTPDQKVDSASVQVWLPPAPQVEKDDVLVFVRENRRVLVDRQVQTEIGTVVVHQVVVGAEINADNILYRLKVESQNLSPLV